ncbi:MAG: polyisoprenyl-teichoic acid--peptidoglycan teichoic acid transferase [Chloroflexota bacterium]|jgi:anionic cell wall polymer biosynthesis LytR-Cps2A-Psr (LCP) family protein/TM2 domain-containing membrane protein YozV|nr:polyisoprenyl-teichoic acid--peptidoglycan teichoic acid transferase [Chloroflexota bacterium]
MSLNPSPAIAALLSFLFPGVGQIYAGDLRKGVLWAMPMILFVLSIIWLLIGPKIAIISLITNPQARVAILVLNVAFFLYHVAAMVDAYSTAKAERHRGFSRTSSSAPLILAALVAVTMLMHGLPEVIGLDVGRALDMFGGIAIPSFTPRPIQSPSITPVAATPTPDVSATPGTSGEPVVTPTPGGSIGPSPTPRACPQTDFTGWAPAADGRLNILLVGSDSRSDDGASTNSIRTDSMMLLSIDIASCKAALFSFPRNMNCDVRYPEWFHIALENGQDYPDCLNYLWRSAAASPNNYPGSEGIGPECQAQFNCERGWQALTGAIQNFANQQIDGRIAVNLKGFVAIVSALPGNGVWIDVPYKLQDLPEPCPTQADPNHKCGYYNSQEQLMPVDFDPGCQFLNPEEALAFARSRHQDDDYQRGRRQQIFLQQVRKQLDPLGMLGSLDSLIAAAQQNLYMTFSSADDFPYLAQIASHVDADRLYRVDFAPARLTEFGSMDGMALKITNIFDEPEPEPPSKNEDPCPAPGQTH